MGDRYAREVVEALLTVQKSNSQTSITWTTVLPSYAQTKRSSRSFEGHWSWHLVGSSSSTRRRRARRCLVTRSVVLAQNRGLLSTV